MDTKRNPTLFEDDNPRDIVAMSYALSVLPSTLNEQHPDISMYFTAFDIMRIVDIYVHKYEKNPISLPTFINKQAYHAVEKVFPGMPLEHFCQIINMFIVLYMSYRVIQHNQWQEDLEKSEDVVIKILEVGCARGEYYMDYIQRDILRIDHVEKY